MVDENDPSSVANGKAILVNLNGLFLSSGKTNHVVKEMIDRAIRNFDNLVRYKDDFAGAPGEITMNQIKRAHLARVLFPHC